MTVENRLSAFRRRLAASDADAALITSPLNMRYLTAFESVFDPGINAACLVTPYTARLYTDFRYAEAAESAAQGTPWTVRIQNESLYIELCRELAGEGVKALALEASVPYGRFKFMSEHFNGRIVVAEHWVEELRQVKEPAELDAIAAAAELADRAWQHILGFLRPGLREVDVAVELESFMRLGGSDGVAFPSIVAGGPNSARPHAQTTTREIAVGEFLKIDFGARIDGYCSDMTRTVVLGKASAKHKAVYSAVLEANEAALAGAKAGMAGADIDAIARELLTSRGHGDDFGHALGHGVGLAVHEMPSVGQRSRDPVRAGSVITIEPGVYLPGFGGVRIEDLVLVQEAGVRLLSHSPKDLLEV